MDDYNQMFGTNFDDKTVKEYTEQVVARMNRTIDDGKYFDIVIVVDQLLTGFNAPQLNTLYVDRTLRGSALIQAYSRTNRVFDNQTKPYGRIVNYRWPNHSEKLMDKALEEYANRQSADIQLKLDGTDDGGGLIAPKFSVVKQKLHQVVDRLADFTDEFQDIPASENERGQMLQDLRQYNHWMALAKQDDSYDEKHPEKLLTELGMSEDDEERLTTTLTNKLKDKIVKDRKLLDVSQIDLDMERVKEVKVNWDYLEELIADVLNKYHEQDIDGAKKSAKQAEGISDQLDDRSYADKIKRFIKRIFSNKVKFNDYPVKQKHIQSLISKSNESDMRAEIFDYKKKWGLADIESAQLVNKIIEAHVVGADDLNSAGELDNIVKEAQMVYKTDAESADVKALSRFKYRSHLRRNLTEFADKVKKEY